MIEPLLDFYRCPKDVANFTVAGSLPTESGYFQFGGDVVCFGRCSLGHASPWPDKGLCDLLPDVKFDRLGVSLPFDPKQVVDNLRYERYVSPNGSATHRMIHGVYYSVRPFLGVPMRKRLQKAFLRGWEELPFPRWPVDTTVEQIFESVLHLALDAAKLDSVPFIWFWPNGASSCVVVTHDVESEKGVDTCSKLMDIDEQHGIRASFQLVPEGRYPVAPRWRDSIRERGFEVNVQDLNHDGNLFRNRREFLVRAESINRYIREYGTRGFRAGAMYRNPDWIGALDISYDLSTPNNAHLEPQRGGCCTVFPYFIGKILELPLTTTQDYSLFHILDDYSIDLWKRQIDLIRQRHGLISFIVHPDYLIPDRARRVYLALLEHLTQLRSAQNVWLTLPGEVDRWWRERSRMDLIRDGDRWVITGAGADRARVAFATRDGDGVTYTVSNEPMPAWRV